MADRNFAAVLIVIPVTLSGRVSSFDRANHSKFGYLTYDISYNFASGVPLMFQRISNMIKGLLDKGLSSAETPEILAEQAQDQLEQEVKELKKAVVDSVTNEKMLEQQRKKHELELAEAEKRAALSVERGDDDLAKQCLLKRQTVNQALSSVDEQLTQQKTATAALKDRLKTVEDKLQEFMRHKPTMTARAQAGDAMSKANELLSNSSGTGGLDKWEQKIREKEARSEALHEMSGGAVDDAFKRASEASKVDDDLAALKAQMGVAKMPKLVVDTQVDEKKPVVDPFVPMKRSAKEAGEENLPQVVDVEVINPDDDAAKK